VLWGHPATSVGMPACMLCGLCMKAEGLASVQRIRVGFFAVQRRARRLD
jgi:hypothetical protein